MKRGRDEEKIMGPMFPRLHVNDAGKGGPRAPPRNKMALYEQLSIPSQRFNPNNTATAVPPSSLSQGSGSENSMFFPIHSRCTTRPDPAENSYSGYSDSNTALAPVMQKKKLNEEDFTVPVFVQSELGHHHSKNSNGMDGEKFSPFGPSYLACSVEVQNTRNGEPKRTSVMGSNLRQEGRSQNKENPKELMAVDQQSVKSVKSSSASEKTRGPSKQFNAAVDLECSGHLASTGASLDHESRARSQLQKSMCGNDVSYEPVRSIKNGHAFIPTRDSCQEKLGSPDNPTFDSEYHEARTRGSLQIGNGDGGDDASETSMVDYISEFDISPDDVVGMIGQKHFWKARRAIVNQQRVFAVQVFELHRLIKVQRLIAGSPHLLLEVGSYLGKPLKGSPAKKLPLELIVKPSAQIVKRKDNSENNPIHKMERSAENTVGKTSLSSVQSSSQPSNHRPFSGNPLSSSVVTDTEMSPWCFPQPAGLQWLIPVMSPSEGLIYKPCPGHGFVGSVCGSFGPPGPNPAMGSFINPAYGGPPSHYSYQGIGIPPAPLVGHGYFPQHGIPVNPGISSSAVEQPNRSSGTGSDGQSGQLSGGEDNFNMHHQSSRNVPAQNGVISNVVQPRTSKACDLQGSTARSRSEKAERIGIDQAKRGRNAIHLFPTSASAPQLDDTDQRTKVIKVVPHNARSATESAARIFRSIQEERIVHDSV